MTDIVGKSFFVYRGMFDHGGEAIIASTEHFKDVIFWKELKDNQFSCSNEFMYLFRGTFGENAGYYIGVDSCSALVYMGEYEVGEQEDGMKVIRVLEE